MQIEDITEYCLNKNKAYIDYPFGDIPICFKVNNKFRYRIILKCKANKAFREFIRQSLQAFAKNEKLRNVSVVADINGEL